MHYLDIILLFHITDSSYMLLFILITYLQSCLPVSTYSHKFICKLYMNKFPCLLRGLQLLFVRRVLLTTRYKERRWDAKRLVGSGGMPSSHSATVTALAIATGFQDGFGSSLFAVAIVFACIVMHDAFGVRLHAGKQAEVLNQIVYELPAEHPLAETRPLRELLGHTPAQVVAGASLGIITAVISHLINRAAS